MGTVWPTEGFGRRLFQLARHLFYIRARENHIRVEHNEVLALGTLRAVITALPGTTVGLGEVFHIQTILVFLHHSATVACGAILYDNDFESLYGLSAKAFKKFVHLVRAVVDGYDE